MTFTATDWTITRATGNIRYTGDDHGGTLPSYATVIELHRALGNFADDGAYVGDDQLDIIDLTPASRSTDNIITLNGIFNIDAGAAEHLYDGSIIQGAGPTEEIWDGIVNFGNPEVAIQIIRANGVIVDDFWNYNIAGTDDTSTAAAFMTDSTATFGVDALIDYSVRNTTDGSWALITDNTGTTITGVLFSNAGTNDWNSGEAYLVAQGLNADSVQGISHRFLLKVREFGVDIDQRRVYGTCRRFGRTYNEFKINATTRGNNVLALVDAADGNNTTAPATVDGWTITNTEGLRLIDINNDTTDEEYYSEWNKGAQEANDLYEYTKLKSADDIFETLQGSDGELHRGVTHSSPFDAETGAHSTNDLYAWGTDIPYTGQTGTFTVGEAIHENAVPSAPVWKGTILADDDNGTTGNLIVLIESGTVGAAETFAGQTSGADATVGTPVAETGGGIIKLLAVGGAAPDDIYYQVMHGDPPKDNDILYDDLDHGIDITLSGAAVERTISTPFLGATTGSAINGAYGIGVTVGEAQAADSYIDLSGAPITPPNNVTFELFGLVDASAPDRVLVTNDDAGGIDQDQLSNDALINGAGVTSIVVTEAIPDDTPATGWIRCVRDSGHISRHPYSAWATSTFTITAANFNGSGVEDQMAATNDVFISYLDDVTAGASMSFDAVYDADRTLFIRVRRGTAGDPPNFILKTYEATAVLSTTGGSNTVIRTSDE